jgi:hypothetical protein
VTRLILTFDDSAAGALKSAKFADIVISFGWRFVSGQLPSLDDLNLQLSRRSAPFAGSGGHWLDNLTGARLTQAKSDGLALVEFCQRFEAIELWADPEPNAQLQLIWLLDHFRHHATIASRLSLIQADSGIADLPSSELSSQRLLAVPIGDTHLDIAGAAWAAWRSSTPEAWFGLLGRDVSALPRLRDAIIALLEELPARASGLGMTQRRLLALIEAGHTHPHDLFPGHAKPNTRRVLGYWETGELLEGLAHGPAPAVTGLDERPFDLAMHNDRDRYARYKQSRLSLTDLGKAILAGTDDFSWHNPIHRWWGGTELSNDRLWRWDPENRALVAP